MADDRMVTAAALLVIVVLLVLAGVWLLGSPTSATPPSRVPWREGELPPGPGWILADLEGEGRFWIKLDPAQVVQGPVRTTLSPTQVSRIVAFKGRLGDLDSSSVEQALANFSRDRDPEQELAIWERIADVFEAELRSRGEVSDEQRQLIYQAVLGCTLTEPRVETLLQTNPRLQDLEGLERIVERWRAP